MSPQTLAVTLGDPCGLGPELVVRSLADTPQKYRERGETLLIIGPLAPLLAALQGRPPFFAVLEGTDQLPEVLAERGPGVYLVEPEGVSGLVYPPGEATTAGGLAAGRSLELAVRLAKAGHIQGLVTCPLNKAMLQQAGFDFPGHTEFLAEGLGVGAKNVTMHLCGPMPTKPDQPVLRVSLVTTHPPLAEVPRLTTREAILRALRHTAEFVARLGLTGPVGVCGLNPHAGESGRIGREDEEIVGPAVREAKAAGLDVVGPIPADTLFHFAAHGRYSAVLAMYHDQGLAPLKLLHFGEAVNVTLGLPIPRTSPDHGTGYDLVGTGKAKLTSFVAALDLARRLAGVEGGADRGEDEKKLLRRLSISVHGLAKCKNILAELANINDVNHVYEAALSFVLVVYARPFSGNEKSKAPKALSKLEKELVVHQLDESELRLHKLILRLRNKALAHSEWKSHPSDIDNNFVISTRPFSVFAELQGFSLADIDRLVAKVHSIMELERAKIITLLQLMS